MMVAQFSRKIKEKEAEFNAFHSTFTIFCEQHDLNQEAEIAEIILRKVTTSEQKRRMAMFVE